MDQHDDKKKIPSLSRFPNFLIIRIKVTQRRARWEGPRHKCRVKVTQSAHQHKCIKNSSIRYVATLSEDGTRGLLKAHGPKDKKIRKPKMLIRKARVVLGSIICNLAGRVRNPPGLCKLVYYETLGSASYIRGSQGTKKGSIPLSKQP
jgi:hypothetical protein